MVQPQPTPQTQSISSSSFSIDPPMDQSTTTTTLNNNPNDTTDIDWKTSLASISGNVLEWYDFSCFGYFSDQIAKNFFPVEESTHSSLTKTFAIFGVGFVARPIGGFIIGRLGDGGTTNEATRPTKRDGSSDTTTQHESIIEEEEHQQHRALALKISILLMAIPTFILGCLPTYQTIGSAATLLLLLVRILQGASAGGQLMSSVVFTIEDAPVNRRALRGASVFTSSSLGVALGSGMSWVLRVSLDDEEMENWGWRIPFWLALVGTVPSFYLEEKKAKKVETAAVATAAAADADGSSNGGGDREGGGAEGEETEWKYEEDDNNEVTGSSTEAAKLTIITPPPSSFYHETFYSRSNIRGLISAILVPCMPSALYYITMVWLVNYMEDIRDPPVPHAFGINTAMCLLQIPITMGAGCAVDYLVTTKLPFLRCCNSYKVVMGVILILVAIGSPLLLRIFALPGYGTNVWVVISCAVVLIVLLAFYSGAMLPFLLCIFPRSVRLTGMAVGYNISVCICGGFAPWLATSVYRVDGMGGVGFIVSILAVVSGYGVWLGPTDRWMEEEEDVCKEGREKEEREEMLQRINEMELI